LLNRCDCQQSGSMSAAQACGGENDADGGCRQTKRNWTAFLLRIYLVAREEL